MVKSMTAFGRAKVCSQERDVTVEIKSVNSRFFDCTVKLPRAYIFLEERIKARVQSTAISRAKVDVYITVDEHTAGASSVGVDLALAQSYISALKSLRDSFGLRDDISVMTVAANRDLFTYTKPEEDLEADWALFLEALDGAISSYVDMRCAEGEKIERDISAKIDEVNELTKIIEEISESDTVGYRDKLEARLRTILADNSVTVDENRLLTECAVWADKIAIDEELVRLRSHFTAFHDICALPEPSGRKLDFLMQEMNRETNTIGSKCNNSRIARTVVDIKGLLEKVREQVQNIE